MEHEDSEKEQKIEIYPSEGVVDYATEYKKIKKSEADVISSARYFMALRQKHIEEIFDSYDELIKNLTFEQAQAILNEFLSPTCSMLEFEYRNLTKKGRNDPLPKDKVGVRLNWNELWQKHILGAVLTDSVTNGIEPTCSYSGPSIEVFPQPVYVQTMPNFADITEALCNDLNSMAKPESNETNQLEQTVEHPTIEIYTVYRKAKWFIENVNVDELDISKRKRKACKLAVSTFKKSYLLTLRVVRIFCYMEVLESLKSGNGIEQKIIGIFQKCSDMLRDQNEVHSKEIESLEQCANHFLKKYREDADEETLIRIGFKYMDTKIKSRKRNSFCKTKNPYIYHVASGLAAEELKMNHSYSIFESVHDFSGFEQGK